MKSANDPNVNYKKLVCEGYDRCSQTYADSRRQENPLGLSLLIAQLPPSANMLDIGCGSGIPVCRELAKHGSLTGVDISSAMISLAKRNVPTAEFRCGDIMDLSFNPNSFDAITSFYAIFHIPREEHEELFRRIHTWLKPGGFLLITVGLDDDPSYTEDDFFDVTMFWSNFDLPRYTEILSTLGFGIIDDARLGHGFMDGVKDEQESHPLIFAQKNR